MLIQDNTTLKQLLKKIKNTDTPIVYIDTEFSRKPNVHYPILSLLQIAFEDKAFVIDFMSDYVQIDVIEEILFSDKILKVLHGCSQDLLAIFSFFGKFPQPIFDTQIANLFCSNTNNNISYAELVKQITNVKLDKKEMKRTDWRKRPLSQKQIKYAEEDVIYLKHAYLNLNQKLIENKTKDWFVEEMSSMVNCPVYIPANLWPEIQNNKEFKIFNTIFEWLDITKIYMNESNILSLKCETFDETLFKQLQLYIEYEITKEEQLLLRSLLIKNQVTEIGNIQNKVANEDIFSDLAMLLLRKKCIELNISQRLIGNKKNIISLIHNNASTLSVGWRLKVFGKILYDLLESKIELSMKIHTDKNSKKIFELLVQNSTQKQHA